MKYYKVLLVFGLIILPLVSTPLQNISMTPETNSTFNLQDDTGQSDLYSVNYIISGFEIQIDHAYYYDLDNDGYEDDVYSIITVSTVSGLPEHIDAKIYQYLTLPSGKTYYFSIEVTGFDATYSIYSEWYDVATESGWYTLEVTVKNYYFSVYSYDEDVLVFDPPKEGPPGAMPRVECGFC